MKIIHTSDWHLGHKLYNWDRSDEELHFFNQLRDVVASEQPDALLVAGDVFHTGTPGNDVAKSFTDRLLDVTSAAPGMETIVIAGNHDSYSRLVVDKTLWQRCRVHIVGVPAEDSGGMAQFNENIIELPGKGIIAAVPFCHARNFPLVHNADAETDRQTAYFTGLRAHIHAHDPLPIILMAHLAVGYGIDFTGQDRSSVIGGEECVDAATLGTGYDYIALGHIHHPQWVKSSTRIVRYCGTPRAIHFDETYGHGVDVVEVTHGSEPKLETKVFEPLRKLITIGGAKGLPFDEALKAFEKLPEFMRESYVRFNVALAADEMFGCDWIERARAAVEVRGGRFCLVNAIRETKDSQNEIKMNVITMDELRELSNGEVEKILLAHRPISETQNTLLRDVIEQVFDDARSII